MNYLLAAACGALLPLSLAPFDLWPLGLVAVGGWFALLLRSESSGLLLGWAFGVGKYAVGVSWVYVSINVYGNAPPLLAAFLVVLFAGGLALFPMLNGWLFQRLRSAASPLQNAWLFTCLFVGFEWLLTWVLTGFPWLFPAYAHLDTVLAGFAPVGGVLLVSFVLIGSTCFAVAGYRSERKAAALAAALSPWLVGLLLTQINWVTPGVSRSVALVQGNIDQAVKWLPQSRSAIIETYVGLSEPHWGVDVMVWPEAAITLMAHEAGNVLRVLDERGEQARTALVLGLPALERLPDNGEVVFRNTAIGMGAAEGRYVKRRLVPFGEYMPLEGLLRGLIEFFDLPMSHAAAGAWRQPLLQLLFDETAVDRAALAICYEIVYPGLVREQAREADVLITISNDSWFGASIGPLQHLQMARMRALENGRWLLRGTNNGVTAIVDHRGAVTAQLPQFTADVLTGSYQPMQGRTPYSRYGDWPLLTVLAVGVLFSA
ncbi:MAG: apolipoprotein N-acyltransferase, partial [Gammaproteobacteria bacterium]|nr:apolipoprotein N-acyltransferase [Gammaproteobacteria bacterium]